MPPPLNDPLDPLDSPPPTEEPELPADPVIEQAEEPVTVPTIGELIAAKKAADAAFTRCLGVLGPACVQAEDGSIEVYVPDGSSAGYHVIRPVPGSTPIPPPPPQ